MKKYGQALAAALAISLAAAVIAPAALFAETQHEKHIRLAAELLKKMSAEQDAEAFADSIASCKGVAIFPRLIQAGLGIGGMGGEGVVLVRNSKGGWNGPSFVSLFGGSFGLQIGVQEVGLVLAINNDDGLLVFTGGSSFKLGGDVSIAAGPMGRKAEAATDARVKASIYSYSMSRGLFAGLTLSGSTINVNGDANKAYWDKATDAKTALAKPANGAKIKPLVSELNRLAKMK
jgi:lipid-binding SYLF domain-containing protein